MTDENPPDTSELDEIDERMGDPWSMTEREYDLANRWFGSWLAIIALICLGGWLVCRYLVNGNG